MARFAVFFVAVMLSVRVFAQPEPVSVMRDALVLAPTSRPARAPINRDVIQYLRATDAWRRPTEGLVVELPDGSTKPWAKAAVNDNGSVQCQGGGSVFAIVTSDSDRIAVLHTRGCSTVYVNGEPRAGDPYGAGYWRLPVFLRKGKNEFLFLGARGDVFGTLADPPAPAYIDLADSTLPDIVIGDDAVLAAGVTVVNASTEPLVGVHINSVASDAGAGHVWSNFTNELRIEPLTIRKVPIFISMAKPGVPGTARVDLFLNRQSQRLYETHIDLRVCPPGENHKRTFVSETDGSVQYYAVNPARPLAGTAQPPALVLSLHGAGVEATSQAGSYSGKTWAHIICPTNRRPFGFDWEDWGRLDAIEALQHAKLYYPHDASRVYLTGHSMGGHGTWSLSCLVPEMFAAAAPSAGWISFASYTGAPQPENPSAVEALLFRSAAASDTLRMVRNISPLGVFILHGDADDNVPVSQARTMREELEKFHKDFSGHEQPGAGHWWENSDEPGAECLDWPGIFDLFARRRIPANAEVRDVDFTTVNPRVSSRMRWLTIEAQQRSLETSNATVRCDPGQRRFVGTTSNVLRLSLDLSHLETGKPVAVELDGVKLTEIPWPSEARIHLTKAGGAWQAASAPSAGLKGPHRAGPFKDALRNRAVFVYATGGTQEENQLAYAKARYDAEVFAYRGNGSFELMPDTAFEADKNPDRNVMLYGNADTNRSWHGMLSGSPVEVSRGGLRVAEKSLRADDLACLFIRPRAGSDTALVGAVAATGVAGWRVAERLPVFLSGVGFPDLLVISPAIFKDGSTAVLGAGYFGDDWSVESGEFAWSN